MRSGESETVSELRRRFQEEETAYKRKLAAYQEGQQRQAQLVQRLQNKVATHVITFCFITVDIWMCINLTKINNYAKIKWRL